MTTILVLFGVSIASLALLIVTFRIEEQKGVRFFENARLVLDIHAERFYVRYNHLHSSFTRDAIRQTVHFILHLCLVSIHRCVKWVHDHFDTLIRVNKTMAHRTAQSEKKVKGKLSDVLEHKKKIVLSVEERKKQKERAIGTYL